jgi:cyclopropane fatty-acyl-phospholipid synthase-like methyltransferase
MVTDLQETIRQYWEDPNTVSLLDSNLRKLEEAVVLRYLEPNHEIIDIGCGDATSTLLYASRVKRCVGLEQSQHLRAMALNNVETSGLSNTTIVDGNILELDPHRDQFDVAITQRVIINLTSWQEQKRAIENVRSTLRPGGIFVMIENTYEGHDALNALREVVGLKKISKHWHNLYFHHDELMKFLTSHFRVLAHHSFDLYYLLTRIYVSMFSSFEGFGRHAVKDPIFDTADAAARQLYHSAGETIRIGGGPSFGPIQGFVLRRLD